ncbi:MAG: cache domain-containing protein [Bauldia sp.]|nr:cache domain-containing protein [Bauldia sp.]
MFIRWCTMAAALGLTLASADAADHATPEEIIANVREAADHVMVEGEAGLAIFDRASSPYVWKDSYVFVWNCAAGTVVAHPVAASRGVPISSLVDAAGKPLGKALCDAAAVPGGSWVEYVWPEPVAEEGADDLVYSGAPARKVSYMLSVEGQPFQVGAGTYDDSLAIADLDALLAR